MHMNKKVVAVTLLFLVLPVQSMQFYKIATKAIGALFPASILAPHYRIRKAHAQERSDALVSFKRPEKVQDKVDRVFDSQKDNTYWSLYNGSDWYGSLGIEEEVLVKKLISSGKKDIYIMDVGCGKGDWGRNIKRILNTQYKRSKTRFHIFSVTGGKECKEEITTTGNVTLYQLNQVKIENIDEELVRRGFDLNNKVDIIVSNWALRHLVDPFGTVGRLYGLLNPAGGKLSSNGFLYKLDTANQMLRTGRYKKTEVCPNDYPQILANSNAITLFRHHNVGRSVDQFMLERNSEKPLNLPLQYTGFTENLGWGWQCASDTVTAFQVTKDIGNEPIHVILNNTKKYEDRYYCVTGDVQCKELYARLKKQGYFDSPNAEKKRIKKESEHWFIAQ